MAMVRRHTPHRHLSSSLLGFERLYPGFSTDSILLKGLNLEFLIR
jgi:hypothetical protein